MHKYKTTVVRNNTTTEFFTGTDEFLLHRDQTYVNTGKIIEIVSTISNNRLTKEIITVFADQKYRKEYKKDPIIRKNTVASNVYNVENSIEKTSSSIE